VRVITVTWRFPEPTEPFVVEKLRGLTARGVDCVVVTPRVVNAESGITIRRVANGDSARELAHAAMAAARRDWVGTRRALATADPHDRARALALVDPRADVIHFEGANMAFAYRHLIPGLRPATVVTCHGSDVRLPSLRSAAIRDGLAEVFTMIDRIHCVSSELADQCLGLGARTDQ
jgi:transposase